MASLGSDKRALLEKVVVDARMAAEAAARDALNRLAVEEREAPPSLPAEQRELRNALRAKARQRGNGVVRDGLPLLVEEIAYAQWHRMLFARVLADHRLLRHPSGAPVSLRDCADLAEEEQAADAWDLAARYASAMLPGLFPDDDPAHSLRFAPEGRATLERILNRLPPSFFLADDALGWVYQFWQTEKKRTVSASGRKLAGADLAAYTQLFTEDYMVRFLLDNTLGAWWAARHPGSPLIADFAYLRFRDDGTPAAGTFPGWPDRAAEITVMDPCCGSGHFLVRAFEMLTRMRREEEGLSEAEAADAVLRDNLFGLELDMRCTQIATFALALAAWQRGGHPERHPPHVACAGLPVRGQLDDWRRLARGDERLRDALERLHALFADAPVLGSLIEPRRAIPSGLFAPRWEDVERAIERALRRERASDPGLAIFGHAAEGAARAAALLGRTYTLVATNVPYLKRGSQDETLKAFCERHHPDAKADLATVFLDRCLAFCAERGSVAAVTPQNWLFLTSYRHFRTRLLELESFNVVARLGPGAFETISGEVVNVALLVITREAPSLGQTFAGLDAAAPTSPAEKARLLREAPLQILSQQEQRHNPDARIALEAIHSGTLLESYASGLQGIATADYPRFGRCFWEIPAIGGGWAYQLSTVNSTVSYGGREHILWWEHGQGELANFPGVRRCGQQAWGKCGVAVSQMGDLPVTLYTGELFDNNTAVILPKDPAHLPAIWAFCSSPEFAREVRKIDTALKVTNATLVKVPFDLAHWQRVAAERYPDGLPAPSSNDPTQWLFKGHPKGSADPLQVAVARLLGYHWPEQAPDELDTFADADGIVCLPPVAGELPAAERLRALLAAAYGAEWSPALLAELLAGAGFAGKDLATWLADRNGFFAQHCKRFHHRPFIWQIWDGRRDGFSALINYHKLDAQRLEKLTYHYLGSWIAAQRAAVRDGDPGAEARLVAAQALQKKLELIREGEQPYDIFVRWKSLAQQPIGWEPDLNDGVRLNIRPFVVAGILRDRVSVTWNKDRGTNPDGSERINDRHLTLAEKRRARQAAG